MCCKQYKTCLELVDGHYSFMCLPTYILVITSIIFWSTELFPNEIDVFINAMVVSFDKFESCWAFKLHFGYFTLLKYSFGRCISILKSIIGIQFSLIFQEVTSLYSWECLSIDLVIFFSRFGCFSKYLVDCLEEVVKSMNLF